MVLAMHRQSDLRCVFKRVFEDDHLKQLYTRHDSYIWQCKAEIMQVLQYMSELRHEDLVAAKNPVIVEFTAWQKQR